jgi:glycosyltransferase involved in cell wall biosynthesis
VIMQDARISVVVTLYNKREYVRRAVESIARQRLMPLEVVVVDDGSTDDGAETLQSFVDRGFVRLVHQQNGGEGAARNRGIREAKGSLITMLDADDEWEPDFLFAIAALADRYPEAGLMATGYRTIHRGFATETTLAAPQTDTRLLVRNYFAEASRAQFVWISAMAVRTAAYRDVGPYREGEPLGCDLDMIGRLALRAPIAYDARFLSRYRNDAIGRVVVTHGRRSPRLPPFLRTVRDGLEPTVEAGLPPGFETYIDGLTTRYAYQLAASGDAVALAGLLREHRHLGTLGDRVVLKSGCSLGTLQIAALWQRVKTSRWMLERQRRATSGAVHRVAGSEDWTEEYSCSR